MDNTMTVNDDYTWFKVGIKEEKQLNILVQCKILLIQSIKPV